MSVTVDGTNGITAPGIKTGSAYSMVRLNTANGYGSTNTKIRRFTNQVINQGTDITYADSATLGATFTVNTSGVYSISYTDIFSAAATQGVSLSSANLTTNIVSLPVGEILTAASINSANYAIASSWIGYLAVGSVIRAHTDGTSVGATYPNVVQFTIARVA